MSGFLKKYYLDLLLMTGGIQKNIPGLLPFQNYKQSPRASLVCDCLDSLDIAVEGKKEQKGRTFYRPLFVPSSPLATILDDDNT